MWKCKECSVELASRYLLLQHFRQIHGHLRGNYRYPCPYTDCPCTFNIWSKLLNHTYKSHARQLTPKPLEAYTFQCHVCSCRELATERDFFQHLNGHLRHNETVPCVFLGCRFKTNIYSTFNTHRNRKHKQYLLKDFQANVISTSTNFNQLDNSADWLTEPRDTERTLSCDDAAELHLPNFIEEKVACILLKLENIVHVPKVVIDEVLSELHYILCTQSLPLTKATVSDVFQSRNLQVEDSVVDELSTVICKSNPLGIAIAKDGPLATAYKRTQYYTSHFSVVEPVEYILDALRKRTFQYIPLLQSLQQLLSHKGVLDHLETQRIQNQPLSCFQEYRTVRDGEYYKQNPFLSGEGFRIAVNLYVDDFEICNPLGTSRKKHKLCGVYWVLGNLPPGSHSKLTSIYLAVLCKSDDVKAYGYEKVLEPLLQDLYILEQHGVFISQVGQFVKGSVQCVIADNLGAHALGGFVESFSGGSICRFCTGDKSEFQSKDVKSGVFQRRTKETHNVHVQTAQERAAICYGVKKQCVLTERLSHFHVSSGYPPDIVHDLFEGVVPVELARCIGLLISKKYFTLESLNTLIQKFPYKWGDKTNRPHPIPRSFTSSNTIGGNAHENWTLLRLLPFVIGHIIPEDEPAWLVFLDLKDIVELVVAPVHTEETIAYLEAKIYDHRQRYLELFPHVNLLPKHHYLEHYPQMIRCFGPLVALWTMRFEAKHSFFKQVARHTSCFKNITRSLAIKHQFMLAYYTHPSTLKKSSLEVTDVSIMPVDVLSEGVRSKLHQRYPEVTEVHMAKHVSCSGIRYSKGMLIVHGSVDGLPKFNEIIQLCILKEKLCFLVKDVCAWYREHYGGFELSASPTREVALIELGELEDSYPLAEYTVGGLRMVMLKRFVVVKG
uniref:uncharacterized protein LOC124072313 isoform X1 n=1 Tax=Scatophagus argus TaxID=75038 RepID=UPI001ED83A2B|nr:uncharacterized protein LOC124072313 isoform X1 [Scatophagus argus]